MAGAVWSSDPGLAVHGVRHSPPQYPWIHCCLFFINGFMNGSLNVSRALQPLSQGGLAGLTARLVWVYGICCSGSGMGGQGIRVSTRTHGFHPGEPAPDGGLRTSSAREHAPEWRDVSLPAPVRAPGLKAP